MAKAADIFVQCLEREGVEFVFGIPVEENLDLLESLRGSQIKLVLTRCIASMVSRTGYASMSVPDELEQEHGIAEAGTVHFRGSRSDKTN